MKGNLAFNNYLNDDLLIKSNLQIDKEFLEETPDLTIKGGKIYIVEQKLKEPIWATVINQLKRGDNKIDLQERYDWTALVFLRFNEVDQTLLMTFGRTKGLLNEEYIINDFGIDTAKQIVDSQSLKHIKIQTFDDRQTQIQKNSIYSLKEQHLIDPFKLNSIYNFSGNTQIEDLKVTVGGVNNLKIKGGFNFKSDLLSLIGSLLDSYSNRHSIKPLFKVEGNINPINDEALKRKLNKILHNKLEILFNSNRINGNSMRNLYINPNKDINHDDFRGYNFTSIGLPTAKVFSEDELDPAYIFERIQRSLPSNEDKNLETILRKLKNVKINLIYQDSNNDETKTFYNSLYFETVKRYMKYILSDDKWYEIDNNFYQKISRKIEKVCTNDVLDYIAYDSSKHKNENVYNSRLAKVTDTLDLDCTQYKPLKEVRDLAKISPQSNVELADIFNYDSDSQTIQFIHVKKLTGGASHIIHSFTQAKSSAQIFAYDRKNAEEFINLQREENGFSQVPFSDIKNIEIVISLILPLSKIKKAHDPKQLFSILERISLYETINIIYPLGFKFKLNLINSNIKRT